jgi:Ca-activated chloride channel family protein
MAAVPSGCYLLPVLVLLYFWLLRRKTALRFSGLSIVRPPWRPGQTTRRHIPPLRVSPGAIALLIASARPRRSAFAVPAGNHHAGVGPVKRHAMPPTVQPTASVASQETRHKAFRSRPAPQCAMVGIVAFAVTFTAVVWLTLSREDLAAAIDQLAAAVSTAIGNGIVVSSAVPGRQH